MKWRDAAFGTGWIFMSIAGMAWLFGPITADKAVGYASVCFVIGSFIWVGLIVRRVLKKGERHG